MKKAIVTGGAGFIGAHLARELVEQSYETVVVDSLIAGKRERVPEEAAFHQVDIRDTSALTDIFAGAHYVFHLAALPRVQFTIENPHESHDVNVTGTLSVLRAAHAAGVKKVVFSSSCAIYGDREDDALHEGLDARPKSPYAAHKYMGERYMQLFSEIYEVPTVSLRYFNVYGPDDDPNGPYALVITKFIDKRARGEELTITGDGAQTRDFVHVRDVVHANMLAAKNNNVVRGEVLNIGVGLATSVNRIAELVGGPTRYIAPRLEPRFILADSTKARQMLGWEPTIELTDGIAELKEIAGLE